MTTWKNVSRSSAITTAITVAITGSNRRVSACSPRAPIASEVTVTPSCIAAMNRGGSCGEPEHELRPAVALLLELVQARPADGDERVLGRDEVAVQQHERRNGDQLEEEGHVSAPIAGAQVLGGKSLSKEATPEYR